MGDYEYSSLETEIETLKAIYIHELEVNHDDRGRPSCVIVHLYPATADNITEQFVRLTLILQIPPLYPLDIPEISIRNTRGLSDEEIESIYQAIQTLAEERKGNALLFELIEVAKEHLTGINIPSCECAICLYGFVNDDIITKTECFHYFHSHCLDRYVRYTLEKCKEVDEEITAEQSELDMKVGCPVCRLSISFPLSDKKFPPPAESLNVDTSISIDQRKLQAGMKELFIKQKEKGGIIDLEAEKNKFLIEISAVLDSTVNSNNIETANQHTEYSATNVEHKESHIENVVETINIKSEKQMGESLHPNNKDENGCSKSPFRYQHKPNDTLSNKDERYLFSEEYREKMNCTKEISKSQQNGIRKQEIVLENNEVHTNGIVNDFKQEEDMSPHDRRFKTSQRGKVLQEGPSKRQFRENYYPRQVQNRVRNEQRFGNNDKRWQANVYKYKNELEKYVPRQSSINYRSERSKTEVNRKIESRTNNCESKETETDRGEKSSRTENRSEYFGKHNGDSQRTEECFQEGSFRKDTKESNNIEKEGRRYFSGKYATNYRNEQRFRNNFQKRYTENSQRKVHAFRNQNVNCHNTKPKFVKMEQLNESSINETMKESYKKSSYEKDTLQNRNRSRQSSTQVLEYYERDRNGVYDRKHSKHGQRLMEYDRNSTSDGRKLMQGSIKECFDNEKMEQAQTYSKNHMDKKTNVEVSRQATSVQKMVRQAEVESNEIEFEGTLQLLTKDDQASKKEEKSKNVNAHIKNSYRGRYGYHRGFRNRNVERQYKYDSEERDSYNGKSVLEQKNYKYSLDSDINQIHASSKINTNEESNIEVSKHSFDVQVDLQLNETEFEDTLQQPRKDAKKHEERGKNLNARDKNNFRSRPRGRRGFHYRTNERYQNGSEDGDNYSKKYILKENSDHKNNSKQLSEQTKQSQNSSNLNYVEIGGDKEEKIILQKLNNDGNNVLHTLPRTDLAKASVKHRHVYFYPRSRGNYHKNNSNRTAVESNYNSQEKYRDSIDSNILPNSKDEKLEPINISYKTEVEEYISHR